MAISQYPEIDRTRRLAELRQYGYITAPGEWRGVGAERVHSIPRGMDPFMVAGKYPTQKDYDKHVDEIEVPPDKPEDRKLQRGDLLYPPGDKRNLPLLEENYLGPKWPGPSSKPVPKPPKKRSDSENPIMRMLAQAWAPYSKADSTMRSSVDQYLKDNPETLSGMVGPGSAGPVGMMFKLNPGRVPALSLANQIDDNLKKGATTILKGLTRDPTTWWAVDSAATKAAGTGEQFYQLNEALRKSTQGPADGRMGLSFDPTTGIAKLAFVGVVPTERGSGFGGELARSAILKAKQLGAKELQLNALPGDVMSEASKSRDLSLVDWYRSMGFVEQLDQPKVGGMAPMHIPDLTKWPPTGKGNLEYDMRNRTFRRLIEGMDPKARPPDVPPTDAKYFVPEAVPREVDELSSIPFSQRTDNEFTARARNRNILRDHVGAPYDIVEQVRRGGPMPEAWSSPGSAVMSRWYVSPGAAHFESARDHYGNVGPDRGLIDTPTPPRTDRGRPDPGESWSDYLARIRGLQR